MSGNVGDALDQQIRIVLNECSDVAGFLDRFAAADPREQVTMGTKHLKMLEQAVRRAAAAYLALVERDAEQALAPPGKTQEVRDLEAVVAGLTSALAEAGARSAARTNALEAALAESRTALAESQDRGAAMAEALVPFAVTAGRAEMGYVRDEERLRLEKASEAPVSEDLRGRDFRRAASALAGSPRPEFGVTTVEALRDAWNEGLRYAMLEQANKRTVAWDTASYAACYAYADRYATSADGRCPLGLGKTPGICSAWTCQVCTSERYAAALARVAELEAAVPEASPPADLDTRLRENGMFTIGEMMGTTPLTRWQTHTGVQDLESFAGWLDTQVRQFLTMQVEYQIGEKGKDDELYEWVQAHSGALQAVRINFRAALARSAAPLLALVDELDRKAEFERLLTVDDGRRVAALARQLVAHLRETYPLPPRKEN